MQEVQMDDMFTGPDVWETAGGHGQTRSGSVGKGESNPNRQTRPPFKGNTPTMNGHVFQCHDERSDLVNYNKTMEALYAYAKTFLPGPPNRSLINQSTQVKKPVKKMILFSKRTYLNLYSIIESSAVISLPSMPSHGANVAKLSRASLRHSVPSLRSSRPTTACDYLKRTGPSCRS